MKPGRNDPCPCGSGEKFKKCCSTKSGVARLTTQNVHTNDAMPTTEECSQLVALFSAGRYVELESRTRLLVEQYPESGFAWKVFGASLRAQGKEALPAIRKATELLPSDAEAHCNLASVLYETGQLDDAEARYRLALQIKPDLADAHFNLGIILHLSRANEAEASYRRALQIRPDYAETHNNLGITLQKLGRLEEAEASYRRALQTKSNYAEAHNNLGLILQELGRLNEAEASYCNALMIKPDFAEAHYNLGNTLHALNHLNEAEASYRNALKIKPNSAEAHYNLGNTLHALNRLNEAEASYHKALEIKPDFAEIHNNLGNTLRDSGRLAEAEASYRRALAIKPVSAEWHNNLGNTLRDFGRLTEAEASYRQAIAIKPDFAEAHNNLGHILCDLDNMGQAALAYQKALNIDPANNGLDAAIYLAILNYLDGNFEQCQSKLLASRPILTMDEPKFKNSRSYWRYLDALLSWHCQSGYRCIQRHDMATLHVIGESHSLSAHGMVVRYNGQKMQCSAEWILGCKQWHLGNDKPNKYKDKFEAVMARLPRESLIMLTIGEIDCRPNEGILKACEKHQDKMLTEIVEATTNAYIGYAAAIGGRYGHRIIVCGVPATNIPSNTLTAKTAEQLIHLIRHFNATLKSQALTSGMGYLDVYALTDNGNGSASGERHLDNYHLLPSAVVEAFDRFYFKGSIA